MSDVEYLTAEQLGERLQLHVTTVYRLAASGQLQSVLIGGSRRFPWPQELAQGKRPYHARPPAEPEAV